MAIILWLQLTDGRVMTAGSNPDRRLNELCIELIHPTYLFRSSCRRPVISKYRSRISYDEEFEIESSDANHEEKVALMYPSFTTDCVNTEQRYIGQMDSNALSIKVPLSRNVIALGYYMLFIISE